MIARALVACLLPALAACPASPDAPTIAVAQQPMTLPMPPRPSECVLPYAAMPSEVQRDAFCRAQKLDADTCTANDGAWGVPGLSYPGTPPSCMLPTQDAGHVCTANRQCRRSACKPDDAAYRALPGQAAGRCDKYGTWTARCDATVDNGFVSQPRPCPIY